MRIIAVKTLREFWLRPGRADATEPLRTWVKVVAAAAWSKPTEIKRTFNAADILKDGRAVFDIGGNKYRLVVKINYRRQIVFIRFIGTHRDYDKIDAETI
jgi:mRNA interferase HigB